MTVEEEERPELNNHLIGRVATSVKVDAGLDVSSAEILAVHNGDWDDDVKTAEAKAIRHALTEYGFR